MDARIEQEKAAPTRHGIEKRQRGNDLSVTIRLLPDERAVLDVRAGETGLSRSAYVRACVLGEAGPRAKNAPQIDRREIAALRVDLAQLFDMLIQLPPDADQKAALEAVREAAECCIAALGYAANDR